MWIALTLLCSCSKDTPTLQEGAEPVFYSISLSIEGSGQISLSPMSADNRYPENSNLEVLAVPEEGWSFTHWSVSLITNEPRNFATESPLSPGQLPVWGQCPE